MKIFCKKPAPIDKVFLPIIYCNHYGCPVIFKVIISILHQNLDHRDFVYICMKLKE